MSQALDAQAAANAVFAQLEHHELSDFARREWRYHQRAIDITYQKGWDNREYPWDRAVQNFWRYPLSFGAYAIPSLIMIDESLYDEAVENLRRTIILLKDTPVWDGWVRKGQGPDPICCKNIMYKGHLNLLYGLYQLITGSTEFEAQLRQLTQICVNEYRYNGRYRGFWAIECEHDQVFAPCNAQGVLSLLVYDRLFGTDTYARYGVQVTEFFRTRMADPDTKLYFYKYHPSHQQAEAYLSGANNVWPLTQMHVVDPACDEAFASFKRLLVEDTGSTAHLKECTFSAEPAMGFEESLGMFYLPGLAREYGDRDLWVKALRRFEERYGLQLDGDATRLAAVSATEEVYIQCYLFWGAVHCGWRVVLDHDWEGVVQRRGSHVR